MTDTTQLAIGRGKLYFELFNGNTLAGDGQRYLGNTPGFTLSYSEDAEEKYSSIGGQRVLVDRHVTRRNYKGTVICDEMSHDNVGLWLSAEDVSNIISAATSNVSEIFTVKSGLWYQVGVSDDNPLGERNFHDVTLRKGTDPIPVDGNLLVEEENGRFQVLRNAEDLVNGDALTFRYQRYETRKHNVSNTKKLTGAVTYIADNPIGNNFDFLFPLVDIEPTGTFEFKTDDFQRMTFDFHVKKHPTKELFYAASFIRT